MRLFRIQTSINNFTISFFYLVKNFVNYDNYDNDKIINVCFKIPMSQSMKSFERHGTTLAIIFSRSQWIRFKLEGFMLDKKDSALLWSFDEILIKNQIPSFVNECETWTPKNLIRLNKRLPSFLRDKIKALGYNCRWTSIKNKCVNNQNLRIYIDYCENLFFTSTTVKLQTTESNLAVLQKSIFFFIFRTV